MKKSELNNSMLFKMRCGDLCVLLANSDGMIFYNDNDIRQGYSDYYVSLDDYDEELSNDGDDYDIVAIKQYDSCARAISEVLSGAEPEEWDWVEKVNVKTEESPHTITINLTIDSKCDISEIISQLEQNLKKMKYPQSCTP